MSLCVSQNCSAAMSLVIVKLKVNFLHEQRRYCYLACEKSSSFYVVKLLLIKSSE